MTLAEFLAVDDGDEVPEPEIDPTWEELVALDARFADLLNLARSYHNPRRRRFCANHVYAWELKPRLEDLAGSPAVGVRSCCAPRRRTTWRGRAWGGMPNGAHRAPVG